MTFAWEPIKSALERVFSEAAGIPFIWDNTAKRLPRAPIGVLSLGQSMTVGRDGHHYTFRDSDISVDIYGTRELTINIQICARLAKNAPSSRELAEKARLSLANPSYRDYLRTAGLVFVETHPLVNLDLSRTNRRELRSAFDVVFRLIMQDNAPANIKCFDAIQLENNL